MVYSLVVKPIVFIDVEEVINFYNNKSKHLAERFYQSFFQSLNDIEINPEHYIYVSKPVRRHIIKNFPYKVYYLVADEKIIVIGVAHVKRSNRFIKSKLRNY